MTTGGVLGGEGERDARLAAQETDDVVGVAAPHRFEDVRRDVLRLPDEQVKFRGRRIRSGEVAAMQVFGSRGELSAPQLRQGGVSPMFRCEGWQGFS